MPSIKCASPSAEREHLSPREVAFILGVSIFTIFRLAALKDKGGLAVLELESYRPHARKRVLYASIVRFCDGLRAKYGIEDRRPKLDSPMFRHRDEDLLPFPMTDTIDAQEALRALGYVALRSLVYLIEEGKVEGYKLLPTSAWRISRSSLLRFLKSVRGYRASDPQGSVVGAYVY